MKLSGSASPSDRHVCIECIGDEVLRREIRSINRRRACDYCGARRRAVSLEALADRIDDVYRRIVRRADSYPVADADSDRVSWESNGSAPSDLITEIIECDRRDIATDIASHLSGVHAYAVCHDGDDDVFDEGSDDFEIEIPPHRGFRETWEAFCRSITHEGRFLNSQASTLIGEILDPVIRGDWPRNGTAVKTLEPSETFRLYRGRQANDAAGRAAIMASPRRQFGAPPPHLNVAGRMNAAGIDGFYGSFDEATCVAELRAPVGGSVVVGCFEILRPLRILDLTVLDSSSFRLSYFDEDFIEQHAYNRFLRGFHAELKKPVIPGRESLEYLPTQFVCEYLWSRAAPQFDGLIYGSSQLSGDGRNIVLFPHAITVEGAAVETAGVPAADQGHGPRDDDDLDEVAWMRELPGETDAPDLMRPTIPTLRLLVEETSVCHVRGIVYDLEKRGISAMQEGDPSERLDF